MTAALWNVLGKPVCIDLYHGDNNEDQGAPIDFAALYADGVRFIIHKASQGATYVDPLYAVRRKAALAAGMKWDSYHFCTGEDLSAQLAHAIAAAEPDDTMRMALDVEQNHGSTIGLSQADELVNMLDQKRGAQCLRYSGFGFLTSAATSAKHLVGGPWWFAKYGPQPTASQLQAVGIDPANIHLWQDTESGSRPGIASVIDMSYWLHSAADLAKYPELPAASYSQQTSSPDASNGSQGISSSFPDPMTVAGVLRVQDALNAISAAYACGTADGVVGPRTLASLARLRADRGLSGTGLDAIVWKALFG